MLFLSGQAHLNLDAPRLGRNLVDAIPLSILAAGSQRLAGGRNVGGGALDVGEDGGEAVALARDGGGEVGVRGARRRQLGLEPRGVRAQRRREVRC